MDDWRFDHPIRSGNDIQSFCQFPNGWKPRLVLAICLAPNSDSASHNSGDFTFCFLNCYFSHCHETKSQKMDYCWNNRNNIDFCSRIRRSTICFNPKQCIFLCNVAIFYNCFHFLQFGNIRPILDISF